MRLLALTFRLVVALAAAGVLMYTNSSFGGTSSSSIAYASPLTEQIQAVAEQVTQVAQDPSLPVDAKTQQIDSLAAQFNLLVAQWQQQTGTTESTAPRSACVSSCPQPAGTARPSAAAAVCTALAARVRLLNATNAPAMRRVYLPQAPSC